MKTRKFVLIIALLIVGAFADKSTDEEPTVIEGITVNENSNDSDQSTDLKAEESQVAEERVAVEYDDEDQIALESNVAEDRDDSNFQSFAVAPPEDNYAAESIDSFSAPQPVGSYSAPNSESGDSYGAPQGPVQDSYGSPQAPVQDSYGSPQAPVQDSYGSPQGPVQDSYGSPQAPPVQGPIPVPLPVPVRPQSLVLPQGPPPQNGGHGNGYGPPRPKPPKRPSYRPPPPKRPHLPKRPSYKPPPPPPKRPSYKPRPQYKPRPGPPKPQYKPRPPPPKPQYKPRPQYKPPPPKPSYQPQPSRPQPAYKPGPSVSRPVHVPSVPAPAPAPAPISQPSYGGSSSSSSSSSGDPWPQSQPDMPKITSLDVTCEKNLMKVYVEFDKPFYGIIFSKGHYSDVNCVHLPAGLGRTNAKFDVSINSCGTTGNTENGLYGYGADSGSGTFFENTIVIQYDPQVQEVWDQARKLRCTWHDQYEKSVTFRPFPVDMLDVVRADFAGDNVGCWMQIQVGKGPWASEVSGLVKIGQTMTMVLAIKDDEQKFDMMVRNCMAHDGKRAPIQLVDQKGCVTRPKLMSKFTKIKNFGASASVLSYAHFQAFKFPDSMEVHFQCTIQICRYQCPDQCDAGGSSQPIYGQSSTKQVTSSSSSSSSGDSYGAPQGAPISSGGDSYGSPQAAPIQSSYGSKRSRRSAILEGEEELAVVDETLDEERQMEEEEEEEVERETIEHNETVEVDLSDVGVEKVIQVVSSGDLTFAIQESDNETSVELYPPVTQSWAGDQGYICMSTPAFAATLVILLAILVISCLLSAFLCLRHRSFYGGESSIIAAFANPVFASHKKGHF